MRKINELIDILSRIYSNDCQLDKQSVQEIIMNLELLRDMMNDTEHYRKTYEEWNE